jgi:Protein of unknown function (DUF3667)
VSHSKERSEKICLNCGEILQNRFCPVCGQENIEPKETVWGLISHFAYDITHFDGKFFSTVRYLLTKPGFLSLEHIKGRRVRYLHPIRLYVFTSAFFFIIFFSNFNAEKIMTDKADPLQIELNEKKEAVSSLQKQLPKEKDTTVQLAIQRATIELKKRVIALDAELAKKHILDSIKLEEKLRMDSINMEEVMEEVDSMGKKVPAVAELTKLAVDTISKIQQREFFKKKGKKIDKDSAAKDDDGKNYISIGKVKAKFLSRVGYDAVQKELPPQKKDDWFERSLAYKTIEFNSRINKEGNNTWRLLLDRFFHTFPQVLFISLPFFALILKLLYVRRKQFYYVDHALFSIHLYCATFIIILLIFMTNALSRFSYLGWLDVLTGLLFAGIFFYQYKAMRRFYGQRRFKTLVKFISVNFLGFFLMLLISIAFFLVSLWQFK